jgi:hypothetical protein
VGQADRADQKTEAKNRNDEEEFKRAEAVGLGVEPDTSDVLPSTTIRSQICSHGLEDYGTDARPGDERWYEIGGGRP